MFGRSVDKQTGATLDAIEGAIQTLLRRVSFMSTQLEALKAQIAANGDATKSAILLLQGLKAQLDAAIASGNPADLQALSEQLAAQDQALAAAVTANTPAATDGTAPAVSPVVEPSPSPTPAASSVDPNAPAA